MLGLRPFVRPLIVAYGLSDARPGDGETPFGDCEEDMDDLRRIVDEGDGIVGDVVTIGARAALPRRDVGVSISDDLRGSSEDRRGGDTRNLSIASELPCRRWPSRP